jgi:hypothetical protein
VSCVEVTTFRLADGVDEAAFLAADARAQTDVYYQHPGVVRRTTARGEDGEWLVTVLWGSPDDVAPPTPDLDALVDPASVRTARYRTLD